MLERFCRKWVSFNCRKRGVVLFLLLGVTVFFALQIRRLRIHTAFADLLPQKHEYVKIHNEFSKNFGGGNLVLLAVHVPKGSVYTAETLKKIEAITETVDRIPGVNHHQVFSIAHRRAKTAEISGVFVEQKHVMWPEVPTDPAAIQKIKERVSSSDLLSGPYVSPDHSSVLIAAQFHEGKLDYQEAFTHFKKLIDEHTDARHEIYVAGSPMLVGWGYHYLNEIVLAFLVTMGVMVLILFAYFRSWQGVVVPLISAVVSAVWGLGFASLLKLNLDPLILVVPMLVSARTLSHSVQFMGKFYETLRVHRDRKTAAEAASGALFTPGLLGIGTDALGILLIAMSTIPIMQKLAFFCSFWAASILFSVLVLNPILLTYLPVPKRALEPSRGWVARGLDRLLFLIAGLGRRRLAVVGVAIAIAVVSFLLSQRLVVGDRTVGSGILSSDSHYDRSLRHITEKFFGARPLFIFVRGNQPYSLTEPEVARTVEAFQRAMEESPNVKGTISYVDLIRYFHYVMREGDPKWSLLPPDKDRIGKVLSSIANTAAPGDMERFLTMNYRHAVIQIYFKDTRGTTVTRAMERAKAFIAAHPMKEAKFELAGGIVGLKAAVNEEVAYSTDLTFALILGCIFVWASFSFRSFLIGLLLTGCLALSNYLVFALMALAGIELNIHTLPVSSVGIGIGVDYGFYLLGRVREERSRGRKLESAIRKSIMTSGKAIFLTAVMLVFGVGLWHFLTHVRFIGEMGLLLGILMFFNMLTALLVLPTLLLLFPSLSRRLALGDPPPEDGLPLESAEVSPVLVPIPVGRIAVVAAPRARMQGATTKPSPREGC